MKKTPFLILIILTLLVEIALCFTVTRSIRNEEQDTVLINECLKSVEENLGQEAMYNNALPYTVLDSEGEVIYKSAGEANVSKDSLALSVNEAVRNGDTILDYNEGDGKTGKILFHNTLSERTEKAKKNLMLILFVFSAVQLGLVLAFYIYLKETIVKPFDKMNDFAIRIAGGNLDMPLELDKRHVFGSFTEAFDLMRSELKKAQMAEKAANDEKKETIAKLSHDIKTPVASIKSSSEIGYELAKDEKSKEYFHLINEKADQIKSLTDNLFTSSIHDITEISVTASKQNSSSVKTLLQNADYRKKASDYSVPECEVYIDKLRLQQVFDNIFMNSYKYADTDISVRSAIEKEYLLIEIKDKGPGVKPEELSLLKEKYKRGSNSEGKEGAGLGLYLSNYFIETMGGRMQLDSGDGFTVSVYLRIM